MLTQRLDREVAEALQGPRDIVRELGVGEDGEKLGHELAALLDLYCAEGEACHLHVLVAKQPAEGAAEPVGQGCREPRRFEPHRPPFPLRLVHHGVEESVGGFEVLGRPWTGQERNHARAHGPVAEIPELANGAERVEVRVVGQISEGLGARLEIVVLQHLEGAGHHRAVARGVEEGERPPSHRGRRVREERP